MPITRSLAVILAVLLSLAPHLQVSAAAPSLRDASYPPHEPGRQKDVRKTIRLTKSGTYDYNFQVLRWRGKGKCNQKEGQLPMFDITGKKIVLKNLFILDAPDGIHVSGKDVKIENVYFLNVCEDAITCNDAVDLDITGCYFYDAEDKVIQLNEGRDVEIYGNVFTRFSTAIRATDKMRGVQVRDNLFYDGKRAIFASGNKVDVFVVEGNHAVKVRIFALAEKKATIHLTGRNRMQQVEKRTETGGGGRIKGDK